VNTWFFVTRLRDSLTAYHTDGLPLPPRLLLATRWHPARRTYALAACLYAWLYCHTGFPLPASAPAFYLSAGHHRLDGVYRPANMGLL
jgi:hypothetical protein